MHSEPKFFNPYAEIEVTANNLPHWQHPGATYYITFRLGDSIPADRLEDWRMERESWLAIHPEPWSMETEGEYHRPFTSRIDAWLDAGEGECLLRTPAVGEPLVNTLRHGDEDRYRLHAWVVMPNHAHVLVTLAERATLEIEIGAWKSISARRINRLLGGLEIDGRRTTSIGSFATATISRIASATSEEIRRRRGCRKGITSSTRAIWHWSSRRGSLEHSRSRAAAGPVIMDNQHRAGGGPAP